MNFDPTISLGNVITIVLTLGACIAAWYGLKQIVALLSYRTDRVEKDVETVNQDIHSIEESLKGIAGVLTAQAVQQQTMEHFQKQLDLQREDIEGLRRGEGYILPLNKSAYEVPPSRK